MKSIFQRIIVLWLFLIFLAGGTVIAHTEHTGSMFAINVPERAQKQEITLTDAKKLVKKYRWIYVNASLKHLGEAKAEALKLSNAVGSPLVLIYLSRHVLDQTRNDYPRAFQRAMADIVKYALTDGRHLLVCGRSYGVHQALRVLRQFDNPKILLLGIAPAFGAFGSAISPNVKQYIRDVQYTRCKYGMIASKHDGFTWRSGGAAYKKRIGYRGDNDVGRAMRKNKNNVHIELLSGADHSPIDEYLNHGLVRAMKRSVNHFGMGDTVVGDVVNGRKIDQPSGSSDSRETLNRAVVGLRNLRVVRQNQTSSSRRSRTRSRRTSSSSHERIFLRFSNAYLVHVPGKKTLQIAAQSVVLSYGSLWEIKQMKSYLFHLRHKYWKKFFWQVNTSRKQVHKVINGTFGRLGGTKKILVITVDVVGNANHPDRFMLRFKDAYLVYRVDGQSLQIAAQGCVLSYGRNWEMKALKSYLFHLRHKVWKNFFWMVNSSRKEAIRVSDGTFGKPGGSKTALRVEVEVKK